MVAMISDLWNMWRFEKGWNGWMFNMVPGFSKVVQSVRVSYVTTFFVKVIEENNSNHPILLIKLQDRKSDDSSELIQELIQFGIFGFFWARFPSQCRHLPSGCFKTFSKCCTGTLRNLCLRMLRNSMTPWYQALFRCTIWSPFPWPPSPKCLRLKHSGRNQETLVLFVDDLAIFFHI